MRSGSINNGITLPQVVATALPQIRERLESPDEVHAQWNARQLAPEALPHSGEDSRADWGRRHEGLPGLKHGSSCVAPDGLNGRKMGYGPSRSFRGARRTRNSPGTLACLETASRRAAPQSDLFGPLIRNASGFHPCAFFMLKHRRRALNQPQLGRPPWTWGLGCARFNTPLAA